MKIAVQSYSLVLCFLLINGCASGSGEPNQPTVPPPQKSTATLLVYDGFESRGPNWGRQAGKPENLESARPSTARAGNSALRVRVRLDDNWVAGGPRSELLQPRELGYWQEGQEYWVGASVFFPGNYRDDPMQEIFWQVHGSTRNQQQAEEQRERKNKARGEKSRASVPFMMQSVGDSIVIRGKGIQTVNIKKTKGKWMDFVVHHVFSSKGGGITQVYVNGNLLVDSHDISNMRPEDRLYQKFGLYKSGWKRGFENQSTVSEREIWFDEIRIGGSNSGFAAVSPDNGATRAPGK